MKLRERTIWIRRDKNAKGEIIFKVVESGRNKEGKPRQKFMLYWGKLPTDPLEKLILEYNTAVQSNRRDKIGKIWGKILQLKESQQWQHSFQKRWLGKIRMSEKKDSLSLFFNSVQSLKGVYEKVLQTQALGKIENLEVQSLQEFIKNTKWLTDVRTLIKHKLKRMVPCKRQEIPNWHIRLLKSTFKANTAFKKLLEQDAMKNWSEERLYSVLAKLEFLKRNCDLAEKLLREKSANR